MPRIDDGFPTTVEFSVTPVFGTVLWEKTVTPPGMDGGGPNDTTTMRNVRWRTMAPKKLKTLTEMSGTMAYDPQAFEDLNDMIQVNQLITVNFPDGSTLAFWGWLDKFEPNEVQEGEQPDAEFTIQPSNQDDNGDEVDPVYTEPTS
jgi:hypothetical protein